LGGKFRASQCNQWGICDALFSNYFEDLFYFVLHVQTVLVDKFSVCPSLADDSYVDVTQSRCVLNIKGGGGAAVHSHGRPERHAIPKPASPAPSSARLSSMRFLSVLANRLPWSLSKMTYFLSTGTFNLHSLIQSINKSIIFLNCVFSCVSVLYICAVCALVLVLMHYSLLISTSKDLLANFLTSSRRLPGSRYRLYRRSLLAIQRERQGRDRRHPLARHTCTSHARSQLGRILRPRCLCP